MAHVFRGLLTLLGRWTGAGQRRLGEQCEGDAVLRDSACIQMNQFARTVN